MVVLSWSHVFSRVHASQGVSDMVFPSWSHVLHNSPIVRTPAPGGAYWSTPEALLQSSGVLKGSSSVS